MGSIKFQELFGRITGDQLLHSKDFIWSPWNGARWCSGIDAAIGAHGRGSRPVYYLTVQRP